MTLSREIKGKKFRVHMWDFSFTTRCINKAQLLVEEEISYSGM